MTDPSPGAPKGFAGQSVNPWLQLRLSDLLNLLVGSDTRWSQADTEGPQAGLSHGGLEALQPSPPPMGTPPPSAQFGDEFKQFSDKWMSPEPVAPKPRTQYGVTPPKKKGRGFADQPTSER